MPLGSTTYWCRQLLVKVLLLCILIGRGYTQGTGFIQAGYRLHTGWVQVTHRLGTGYTQAGYRLHTG